MARRRMSHWLPIVFACVAVASGASAVQAQAQNADGVTFKVGVTTRHVLPSGPYDWRGAGSHALLEVVWYPAESGAQPKPQRIPPVGEAIFEAAPAAPEARIALSPQKFPLILLSHGTGGTAQSIAWFATALASRGYIVAAVNHPGNNAMEPYTVQGFVLWWLRAKDISTVLDDILADPDFAPRIDQQQINAAGFSLGGYTMIELAGGITSRRHFDAVCAAAPDQVSCHAPPEFADLLAKARALEASDPGFAQALRGDEQPYRDPRIRAFFAMAPALGPAFTPDSLKTIDRPVMIVAGAADHVVPVDANAKYLAATIPHAALTIFSGGVDHYTFLDQCTPVGRDTRPMLCVDKPGVDREAVHDATVALAAKFFGGR
ncbi:MAG: alpha/beta fold hydrolase [Xanthobacteraceae bacterium]